MRVDSVLNRASLKKNPVASARLSAGRSPIRQEQGGAGNRPKQKNGCRLVAPGTIATVPQWQYRKGSLIVTAALELATNQVTHFYSEKKNTDEIIKLIETLLAHYRDLSCIYLSWDAASWHASKRLAEKIAAINAMAFVTGSTRIELVPLPARAQSTATAGPRARTGRARGTARLRSAGSRADRFQHT